MGCGMAILRTFCYMKQYIYSGIAKNWNLGGGGGGGVSLLYFAFLFLFKLLEIFNV